MARNATQDFLNGIAAGNQDFTYEIDIYPESSSSLTVRDEDIWENGLKFESDSSGSDELQIGTAIIDRGFLSLNNAYDDFNDIDFEGAIAIIRIRMIVNGVRTQPVTYGYYDVVSQNGRNTAIINLELWDYMRRADKPYRGVGTTYPAHLYQIVNDIGLYCNIDVYDSLPYEISQYVVQSRPEDDSLTCRDMLAFVAQLAAGFYKCDEYGRMHFYRYGDYPAFTISSLKTITADANDVEITGVMAAEYGTGDFSSGGAWYQYGQDGYVLNFEENPLIQEGEAQTVAENIGYELVGKTFRPMEASTLYNPLLQCGDCVTINDGTRTYNSIVTSISASAGHFMQIRCEAKSAPMQATSGFNALTRTLIEAGRRARAQLSQYAQQVETMTAVIVGGFGLYRTEVVQADGSKKFYMHDRPVMADSTVVYTMNANGIGMSTDGGRTFPTGVTADGNAVAKILTLIGLRAEWITTGAFTVEDQYGNETFYADKDTGEVRIRASSFSLTNGDTIQDIANDEANTVSQLVVADYYNNTIKPYVDLSIQEATDQIDGRIETWYQDTDPSLNWTTEAMRLDHKGDMWFNSSPNDQKYYVYTGTTWQEMSTAPPQYVMDKIDGKAQIFTTQPVPPYNVNDLYLNGSVVLVCNVKRETGAYNAADWVRKEGYTDDSAATALGTELRGLITNLNNQIDGKIDTWYQSTDPSTDWTTAELRAKHQGDIWFNTTSGVEKFYMYSGLTWQEMKNDPPQAILDKIDGKASVYTVQPTPPYYKNDLYYTGDEVLVCKTTRTTGSYRAADWVRKEGYTDDTAVINMSQDIYNLLNSIDNTQPDGYFQSWRQAADPSANWTDANKLLHRGDLWCKTDNTYHMYSGSEWVEMAVTPPSVLFTANQGTKRIFTQQPTTPYNAYDLYFVGSSIYVSTITKSASEMYESSDWIQMENSGSVSIASLCVFMNQWIESVNVQMDGKIETWYQPNDPSTAWTTVSARADHRGDIWYNTSSNSQKCYVYNGTSWDEMTSSPPSYVLDTIDGKAQIFTTQPTTPYYVGDLYYTGTDVLVCKAQRISGTYRRADWEKKDNYTDDSAVTSLNNSLTQTEIFKRLTNNGAAQGIFMQNGQLYINMSYLKSGMISIGGTNNSYGSLEILDGQNRKAFAFDKDGMVIAMPGSWGNEYITLSELIMRVFYSGFSTTTPVSIIDFSAQNADGSGGINNQLVIANNTGHQPYGGIRIDSRKIWFSFASDNSVSVDIMGDNPLTFYNPRLIFSKIIEITSLTPSTGSYNVTWNGTTRTLGRASSSARKYKDVGSKLDSAYTEKLYGINVYFAKYKEGYLSEDDERYGKYYPMFIADEIEEIEPLIVDHDADGNPENWNERAMIPAMFQMIKSQREEIELLKQELSEIKMMLGK